MQEWEELSNRVWSSDSNCQMQARPRSKDQTRWSAGSRAKLHLRFSRSRLVVVLHALFLCARCLIFRSHSCSMSPRLDVECLVFMSRLQIAFTLCLYSWCLVFMLNVWDDLTYSMLPILVWLLNCVFCSFVSCVRTLCEVVYNYVSVGRHVVL